MDGLSRKDRLERITSTKAFNVIDNSIESLLHQTQTIASFIKYYNLNQEPDDYFDELLIEIHNISRQYEAGLEPKYDGNMEASQALIYAFIHQLHNITEKFNERWKNYPYWYINEVLGIKSLEPLPNNVWVKFDKNVPDTVFIEQGEKFIVNEDDEEKSLIYTLKSNFEVQNISVEQAYSIYFERQKNIFPAATFNCVTGLKTKDLLHDNNDNSLLFVDKRNVLEVQSLGFMISSPSLLLRESKRNVTITFEAENNAFTSFIENKTATLLSSFNTLNPQDIINKILGNIFYLQISTATGWKLVNYYVLKQDDNYKNNLILKFTLPEDFPATTQCNGEVHEFYSQYPTLKVLLNLDAWLYPYSWIKDFLLRRIIIHTEVEDVINLLVYNELGRIDNSKPFMPFGINTERGTWFAIGNYEMAIKNTNLVDVKIKWKQLPDDPQGLKGYYKDYKADIDNTSFKIKPRYLSDYVWKKIVNNNSYFLFATNSMPNDAPIPDMSLIDRSKWENILIDKMLPIDLDEDRYDYSIKSNAGFINFTLEEPAIGFGEKHYRHLFSDMMIRNVRKKKNKSMLNTPITPLIERISMNYAATECIDLRTHSKTDRNTFYHVFPLGCKQLFPNQDNKAIPLIYNMKSDANIIFGLKNIKGGEFLRLYLDFVPVNKEIAELEIPQIKWYYGDRYIWKEMPDGVIAKDTTKGLLFSGCIEFYLPEEINEFYSSNSDAVWICAGIDKNYEHISNLIGIYINTAELELVIDDKNNDKWYDFKKHNKSLAAVRNIPGITNIEVINYFTGGREKETNINKLIRVSEYVSHRGKAVTPRDYERIILQRFTEIEKMKCLPAYNSKDERKGVVTVVVIPNEDKISLSKWQPKTSSNLILEIEDYIKSFVSPYVTVVDVINLDYEELMIRCKVKFKSNFPSGTCHHRLKELCDNIIAPWQNKRNIPRFDYSLNMKTIYNTLLKQEYIEAIDELSIIKIAENNEKYLINEYSETSNSSLLTSNLIEPSKPYAIFVPAKEHLFLYEIETPFGINEMTIDDTFVI